jgi:tetraacyldisaccharide 4'-kinase
MKVHERYPAWMALYGGGRLSSIARPVRFLLSRLYGLHPAHRGSDVRRSAERTDGPLIVSIGNLEWGGGGKTPCAIALCEALAARGHRPAVVTRGYRSEAERNGPYIAASGEAPVGPDGMRCIEEEGLSGRVIGWGDDCGVDSIARLIGDEATLYRARGIPVVVDGRRDRAVEVAARIFHPTHLVMDDAFQNRNAPRDLDILLLDHEKPFGTGELMPLGNLREPPGAVRRADIVLFTRSESDRIPPVTENLIGGKPVFFSSHRPTALWDRARRALPLEYLGGKKAALLSGIARPESFEATIASLGVSPAVSFRFADHHEYRPGDVAWMLERLERNSTLVTTEKDMVKVGCLIPDDIDLVALRIGMEIRELDRLLDRITGGTVPGSPDPAETTSS